MENSTSFGKQAAAYAKGRPGYPYALYRWIADNSPAHNLIWDIGTGSGQAAHALTHYFNRVHATDISAEQIAAAKPHEQISGKPLLDSQRPAFAAQRGKIELMRESSETLSPEIYEVSTSGSVALPE